MHRYQKHQLEALRLGQPLPPPIPRKKMSQEESLMQRSLIKWWTANCRHFGVPELALFSVPNGGARSPVTGKILQLEGARKGVPDLFLAVGHYRYKPVGGPEIRTMRLQIDNCHGLFLELKRPAGIVSPEQEVYHEILTKQGYKVVVCRSLQECINQITTYLK